MINSEIKFVESVLKLITPTDMSCICFVGPVLQQGRHVRVQPGLGQDGRGHRRGVHLRL